MLPGIERNMECVQQVRFLQTNRHRRERRSDGEDRRKAANVAASAVGGTGSPRRAATDGHRDPEAGRGIM